MKQQISLAQYRGIDLFLLTAMMAIAEGAIYLARTTVYSTELINVSIVGAVTALVMMRWSSWAAIPAVVGGVLYAALWGDMPVQYLIYGGGNLLGLLAMVWFWFPGKEKVRKDALLTMAFGLSVQVCMQLGRVGVALLTGTSAAVSIGFITADALSILFTIVAVWIMRRIEGLFEDQKHYLLRIQQERQVEGREQF